MTDTDTLVRPHEKAATTSLREAALLRYEPLRQAVANAAHAVHELRMKGDDIVVVMAKCNVLSLAAEALAVAAKDLHESADAALVRAMGETGAYSIFSAGFNVSLRNGPPSVDVTDRSAVPPEFWVQPEPRPDAAKIRAYLKAHPEGCNWARLIEGKPGLQRRSAT